MSKGMQQRLGIAQALIGGPRMLVLDEPTSALDPAGRRTVRALLEELRAGGTAVLLNSHLLSEIELVCDRVVIITRGRVVAQGSPTELTAAQGVEIETAAGTRRYQVDPRGRAGARGGAGRGGRAGVRGAHDALDPRRGVPRGGRGRDGVSGATVIVGVTLRECLRRRVLAVVALLTAAFLALYAVATHLAFAAVGSARVRQAGVLVDAHALAGATLLGLAMFATLFLGAVLAVFLTFNVIRGDAEQGLLQPVVVRPIGRTVFVAARYGAACGICSAYVAIVYGAAVVITGLDGGWWPDSIVLPGLALAGGVCIVAAIALLGSVYMSTIANGIAVLMVYGAGLVSGLLGQIGYALPSAAPAGHRPRCLVGASVRRALPGGPALADGQHQRLDRRDRPPRPAGRRAGGRAGARRLVARVRGRRAERDRGRPPPAGSLTRRPEAPAGHLAAPNGRRLRTAGAGRALSATRYTPALTRP